MIILLLLRTSIKTVLFHYQYSIIKEHYALETPFTRA